VLPVGDALAGAGCLDVGIVVHVSVDVKNVVFAGVGGVDVAECGAR